MRQVLISRDPRLTEHWQQEFGSAATVCDGQAGAEPLLRHDRGMLCLGPDQWQTFGLVGLEPLIRQQRERDWSVVVLGSDIDGAMARRLYDAGAHDVVLWRDDDPGNWQRLALLLAKPFERELPLDQAEVAVLRRSGIVSWVFDPRTWSFVFLSRNIEKVLGYSADHWYSRNYSFKLVHPDDRTRVDAFFRRIVQQPGLHEIRNRMLAAGGRVVWIKTLINVEADELDDAPRVNGVMLDVTGDQQLVQESIKRSERERHELEQHLNRAPIAVLKANANMEITSWSPGAEAMFGYAVEEVLGRTWSELGLIHPEDEGRVVDELLPLINGQMRYLEVRNRNRRKDGSDVEMHWVNSCLRNADGTLQSLLSMGRDISAEAALEAARTQQAKMDAVLTLSSGIAHDFNNLLTPILLQAEAIEQNGYDAATMRERAAIIKQSALRAREINSTLAQLNRPLKPRRIDVQTAALVGELQRACQGGAFTQHHLGFHYDDAPGAFVADDNLLTQSLLNLLNNAAHAFDRKSGNISLTIGLVDAGKRLRFRVCDDGAGIPLEHQSDIFLPFFTTRRNAKGTGLGLAMVKRIAEAHGGSVSVQSSPGNGACFDIEILYEPAPVVAAVDRVERPARSPALRIAVVDDEPVVLQILCALLESQGHRCQAFNAPQSALLALVDQPGEFDLLLSDQLMPGLTGVELARSLEAANVPVPIVLVTGTVALVDREHHLPPTIKAVLEKPLTGDMMRRCLGRLFPLSA